MAVVDIELDPESCDVNVTPDKRSAMLHDEKAVLALLRTALEGIWEPARHTFAVNGAAAHSQGCASSLAPVAAEASISCAQLLRAPGSLVAVATHLCMVDLQVSPERCTFSCMLCSTV